MARCPLCSERAAKRYCPAKEALICAPCCGTKREVEFLCPPSCSHLKSGRTYEAEKRVLDPELAARVRAFEPTFLQRFSPIIDSLSQAVAAERLESQWLVDSDVIEVYKALAATMKTLSSGIYYETLPEGGVRMSLFRRVKGVLDKWMASDGVHDALRVSDAVHILDFLIFAAVMNSNSRPRSRQYLDWLAEMTGTGESDGEPATRLIVP